MHVISGSEDILRPYKQAGIGNPYLHYEGALPPKELYRELTRYDYGLLPFMPSINIMHLNTALPNKLYEYIAAGLPVVSQPFKSIDEFLTKYGVGLTFNRVNELPSLLKPVNLRQIRDSVMKNRNTFTVENNIDRIIELYYKVLTA